MKHVIRAQERRQRIEKLWNDGLNRQQIVERTGMKIRTVERLLTELDLTSQKTHRLRYDGIGRVAGRFR
jgi:YD repeat-containing protein